MALLDILTAREAEIRGQMEAYDHLVAELAEVRRAIRAVTGEANGEPTRRRHVWPPNPGTQWAIVADALNAAGPKGTTTQAISNESKLQRNVVSAIVSEMKAAGRVSEVSRWKYTLAQNSLPPAPAMRRSA